MRGRHVTFEIRYQALLDDSLFDEGAGLRPGDVGHNMDNVIFGLKLTLSE
jgi:hypothetical protein